MFYSYYLFLLILLPFVLLSAWASAKVRSTFAKYNGLPCASHMTGYDTAVRLLQSNGIKGISVNRIRGTLTDHYHPAKAQVNLSESVFGSASVAACAVAAHEIGHVMQKAKGYGPYRLRTALVPLANIGSRLSLPLILVGVVLDIVFLGTNFAAGRILMYIGIGLYSLSVLFMLVTLPVEFNASRRAGKMLLSFGILNESEAVGARRVLRAAAMTYVASMLVSLVYFLRYLLIVLSLTQKRK